MPRKPKFRPTITRVKLNPEQAVLACTCHAGGVKYAVTKTARMGRTMVCDGAMKTRDLTDSLGGGCDGTVGSSFSSSAAAS